MKLYRGKETVVVLSDLQIPFHNKKTLEFLAYLKKKYKPTKVVGIGDLVDSNNLGDYVKDPDGLSARQEHDKTLKTLESLQKLFPEVVNILGNHDTRIFRKAFSAGIPRHMIKDLEDILEFPDGWSYTDNVVIDRVRYEHGDSYGGEYAAKKAARNNMQSTVIGHHHSDASIHYISNEAHTIFGMNSGCLVDPNSYAFRYAKQMPRKVTLATSVVDKGMPYLEYLS